MGQINLLHCFFVFAASIGGSIIQTTTGFGYGIFVLLFFPLFLPLLQSSALSSLISIWLSLSLAIQYRKSCDYRSIWFPAILYTIVSFLAVWASTRIHAESLKAYFGLFLILVAVYFLFFAKRIHLRSGRPTAAVCSTISGLASGFFGIGGPPMVLYFLAVAGEDKICYLASIQMFFLLTSISNIASRLANGIITVDLLPLTVSGIAGLFLGKAMGVKIVNRVNIEQLKYIIYFFLAASGLITFLANI